MSEQTTTTDTEIRPPIHAAIPDGEVDGGFEHINRIEAMRNRLAAGETTFTLDELKLTLAWADHLNYFRSLDMPRLTALEAENARLRARTHEIAADCDKRMAELQSRVDLFENAYREAKDRTKHLSADWAVEPWKSETGTFWNMTSVVTRDALASFVVREKALEAENAALKHERNKLSSERAFYAKGEDAFIKIWARQRQAFKRIETADTSQQMRDIARGELNHEEGPPLDREAPPLVQVPVVYVEEMRQQNAALKAEVADKDGQLAELKTIISAMKQMALQCAHPEGSKAAAMIALASQGEQER